MPGLFSRNNSQRNRDTVEPIAGHNGHNAVMQWVNQAPNIPLHGQNAFVLAAQNGHLATAQWIYQLANQANPTPSNNNIGPQNP